MNRILTAFLLVAPVLLAACRSTATGGDERRLTLVFLKAGPNSGKLAKDENARLFAGHFANMVRLADERHLLVAGPFGAKRHDPALRGLFILDSGDRAEARAWAETDPPTQAGVFELEYHDLSSSAPLNELLEIELAIEAKAKRDGVALKPGDGIRPYVLLTAEHGDVAAQELAPLRADGRVLFFGRLDEVRALAILDATDLDAARALLGTTVESIGQHTLDVWSSSGELARLPQIAH